MHVCCDFSKVGTQQLPYTGPPIYILLAFYYYNIKFIVIYVYPIKTTLNATCGDLLKVAFTDRRRFKTIKGEISSD